MRHLVPFDRTRGVGRLLALLAGVALLVGITALRHPRTTLNPWRPGPANLIESPVGHQPGPPVDGAPRQASALGAQRAH
jgi:hypothetical protein